MVGEQVGEAWCGAWGRGGQEDWERDQAEKKD